MKSLALPVRFLHEAKPIRAGLIASLSLLAIGLAVPLLIVSLGFGFFEHTILLIVVSGGLVFLGGTLTVMGYSRLKDPVYLAVDADGAGRWRPYFRVRQIQFPIDPPSLIGRRLSWTTRPAAAHIAKNGAGRYYIDLPESVQLHTQVGIKR